MEKKAPEFRELLLKEFILRIVKNITPSPLKEPAQEIPNRLVQQIPLQNTPAKSMQTIPIQQMPQVPQPQRFFPHPSNQRFVPRPQMPISNQMFRSQQITPTNTFFQTPSQRPPQLPPPPQQAKEIPNLAFGKLGNIVRDPSVISIECQGQGKPILVNRSGIIQATQIVLTKEEIKATIDEISEKTRIPVTTGVFKAAIGGFIITAVISEYVGTRFVIQKRMPNYYR